MNRSRRWQGLALLLILACTGGCQLLYDAKLADSQRDCEKRVMQADVSECKRRLQDQQAAFKREQDAKARADTPAAPPAR